MDEDGHIVIDGFQFLIGWLQTLRGTPVKWLDLEFQFLIGWLQTMQKMKLYQIIISFNSLQVGYKPILYDYDNKKNSRFQFLIGWLQTLKEGIDVGITKQFQFLIGWLQTRNYKDW